MTVQCNGCLFSNGSVVVLLMVSEHSEHWLLWCVVELNSQCTATLHHWHWIPYKMSDFPGRTNSFPLDLPSPNINIQHYTLTQPYYNTHFFYICTFYHEVLGFVILYHHIQHFDCVCGLPLCKPCWPKAGNQGVVEFLRRGYLLSSRAISANLNRLGEVVVETGKSYSDIFIM